MKKYLNPEYSMVVACATDVITTSTDIVTIYKGNDYTQTKNVEYVEGTSQVVSVSTTVTANVNTLLGQ